MLSFIKTTFLPVAVWLALAGSAHAETVSPQQLLEVVDFGNPSVSPDGGRAAYRTEQASVERNTYDTVWYVQDMGEGSSPVRVADGGVPLRDSAGISVPTAAVWSPDGRWIYYRALMNGSIDVWRAATDGSGTDAMTLDPADVRDFSLDDGGRTLKYSVGATRDEVIKAEQAEYDRGIRIDKTVPIGRNLFRSGNFEGRLATQRFGKVWFDHASLLADRPERWKAIDLATAQQRDIPSSEAPSSPPNPSDLLADAWKLASDSRSGRIAILVRSGDGAGLLYKPDVELLVLSGPKDKTPVRCRSELCTKKAITGISWRPDSDQVLFTVTDPDADAGAGVHACTGLHHSVDPRTPGRFVCLPSRAAPEVSAQTQAGRL